MAYGWGGLWIGEETVIQDKSGSFYMRDIMVIEEDMDLPARITVPDSYYDYDVDWRNVAVDVHGSVYIFVTEKEGTAEILKWRVSY